MDLSAVIATIGVIILSVTSIGGWVYAVRKNGRSEGRLQQQVQSAIETIKKLPCQADSDYLQNMGALANSVKNVESWLRTIEQNQIAINGRIDDIVDSKPKRRKRKAA